jgi:hypothetical protein
MSRQSTKRSHGRANEFFRFVVMELPYVWP